MPAAYVQSVDDFGTFSSPKTMVLPGNTVAGNKIVVMLFHSYLGCPPSLTDSQGNTYNVVGAQPDTGATGSLWVFEATAGQSAACTITATYSCGNIRQFLAVEASGLQASPFDVEATGTDASSPYGIAVTTTTNGALVLTMSNKEGSDIEATSYDAPFTFITDGVTYSTGYAIQTSAGSITPALNGPTGTIVCATVAFKAGAAAALEQEPYFAKLSFGRYFRQVKPTGLLAGIDTPIEPDEGVPPPAGGSGTALQGNLYNAPWTD